LDFFILRLKIDDNYYEIKKSSNFIPCLIKSKSLTQEANVDLQTWSRSCMLFIFLVQYSVNLGFFMIFSFMKLGEFWQTEEISKKYRNGLR
jgi:hypothetical protein